MTKGKRDSLEQSAQRPEVLDDDDSDNTLVLDGARASDISAFTLDDGDLTSWDVVTEAPGMQPGSGISKIVVTSGTQHQKTRKKGGNRKRSKARAVKGSRNFNVDRLKEIAEESSTNMELLVAF